MNNININVERHSLTEYLTFYYITIIIDNNEKIRIFYCEIKQEKINKNCNFVANTVK